MIYSSFIFYSYKSSIKTSDSSKLSINPTLAILLFSELQENDVEAPEGVTIGVSVLDSPIIKLREEGNETPVGVDSFTVTIQYGAFAALDILEYTLIYAVPGLIAVTSPELETVAMRVLLLLKYAFAAYDEDSSCKP